MAQVTKAHLSFSINSSCAMRCASLDESVGILNQLRNLSLVLKLRLFCQCVAVFLVIWLSNVIVFYHLVGFSALSLRCARVHFNLLVILDWGEQVCGELVKGCGFSLHLLNGLSERPSLAKCPNLLLSMDEHAFGQRRHVTLIGITQTGLVGSSLD